MATPARINIPENFKPNSLNRNKKTLTLKVRILYLVLGVGFEPTKANADRFTVCCV